MDEYPKKEVTEYTGLSPRLIQFYTEQGVVTPGVSLGKGRGTLRKYSKVNLVEFCIIKKLTDYGITIHIIKEILQKTFDERPGGECLISYYLEFWKNYKKTEYYLLVCKELDKDTLNSSLIWTRKGEYIIHPDIFKKYESVLVVKLNQIFNMVFELKKNKKHQEL